MPAGLVQDSQWLTAKNRLWLLLDVLQSTPVSSNMIGFSKMTFLKSFKILQRSIFVLVTVFGIIVYSVNFIVLVYSVMGNEWQLVFQPSLLAETYSNTVLCDWNCTRDCFVRFLDWPWVCRFGQYLSWYMLACVSKAAFPSWLVLRYWQKSLIHSRRI